MQAGGGAGGEGVEVALDPSELDLDAATMTARYIPGPIEGRERERERFIFCVCSGMRSR